MQRELGDVDFPWKHERQHLAGNQRPKRHLARRRLASCTASHWTNDDLLLTRSLELSSSRLEELREL